jgi:ABC-2 type transport system ATP-binding protein
MIRVESVTRRYGDITAVDAVSLQVEAGQIVGFLGPNGAGKSTLLKMLSTYLPPTSGRIVIDGLDIAVDPLGARQRIGYLPEHNALFESMRVDRFLAFIAGVRGLAGRTERERTAWVVDRCSLATVLAKRVRECSKGFRQRIGLAAALIHDPPVLLLDEPTHGLDPLQVVAFREFLHELRPGRAILFSSHILAEVATISDRLLAIQGGRIVLDQPTPVLAERGRREKRTIEEIVIEAVQASRESSNIGSVA